MVAQPSNTPTARSRRSRVSQDEAAEPETAATAPASADAAPMTIPGRAAAESWPAAVQVAAARNKVQRLDKMQRLGATRGPPRFAAADMAAPACGPARRPVAAQAAISAAAGSVRKPCRKPWQYR